MTQPTVEHESGHGVSQAALGETTTNNNGSEPPTLPPDLLSLVRLCLSLSGLTPVIGTLGKFPHVGQCQLFIGGFTLPNNLLWYTLQFQGFLSKHRYLSIHMCVPVSSINPTLNPHSPCLVQDSIFTFQIQISGIVYYCQVTVNAIDNSY